MYFGKEEDRDLLHGEEDLPPDDTLSVWQVVIVTFVILLGIGLLVYVTINPRK